MFEKNEDIVGFPIIKSKQIENEKYVSDLVKTTINTVLDRELIIKKFISHVDFIKEYPNNKTYGVNVNWKDIDRQRYEIISDDYKLVLVKDEITFERGKTGFKLMFAGVYGVYLTEDEFGTLKDKFKEIL